MSKNNTIRKSDKKFIRTEKARIRVQFSDTKKQQELINELYNKVLNKPVAVVETAAVKEVKPETPEIKKETKEKSVKIQKPKAEAKPKKAKAK